MPRRAQPRGVSAFRRRHTSCVADLISRTVAPGNEWWDAEASARAVLLSCLLAVLWIRGVLGVGTFGRTLAVLDLLAVLHLRRLGRRGLARVVEPSERWMVARHQLADQLRHDHHAVGAIHQHHHAL